ncbi:hypothetical protein ACIBK9_48125 [Nonomuraea sp. NPDC050227]|uniref:hypothetical protein n=1 Tax=Nonomuraea sp. NPDC050227 TaxID=3364360 RepID=UPI0037A12BF6
MATSEPISSSGSVAMSQPSSIRLSSDIASSTANNNAPQLSPSDVGDLSGTSCRSITDLPVSGLASSLALDVAEHAFNLLMRGPSPLSVDGAALGQGLPARPIPMNELRAILLHPSCSRTTRDHVWRHLIDQARTHRGAWMVAAVALAIPMLRRLATTLTDKIYPGQSGRLARADREDLEAEVLAAYIEALTRVKLAWSHPVLRLSRLAQFTVLRAYASERPGLLADPDLIDRPDERQHPLAYPAGHPDLLLAQAVADGVITELEAELIGFTRLEGVSLSSYCRRRGLLYCTALKRRQRAENALYQALLKHNR